MKKFEYLVIRASRIKLGVDFVWKIEDGLGRNNIIEGSLNKTVMQILNEFGEEGWEYSGKTQIYASLEFQGYILKREKDVYNKD